MIDRIAEIAGDICLASFCLQLGCKGDADRVDITIDLHPRVAAAALLSSIKSASSRILRKEFKPELRPHFPNWNKGLWENKLYIRSINGALLDFPPASDT